MNRTELEIIRFCSRVTAKLSPFPDLRKDERVNSCIYLSGLVIGEIVEIELEGLDRDKRLDRILLNLNDLKKKLDACSSLVDVSLIQYDPEITIDDMIKSLK